MFFGKDVRYMQYLACFTGTLSVTIMGMFVTWPSPSLPHLTSGDSPIGRPVTVEEGSWIVSLVLVAPIILTVQTNWVLEKYGRKFSLLISAIPAIVSWVMTIYAESVIVLCIARFIGGVSQAFQNAAVSMYIGEIADKDIRGKLGTAFILMKLVGCTITMGVGPFVSYTTLGWISCSVPVLFFFSFMIMPESPYFLVKIGKKEQAFKNLSALSCKNTSSDAIEKKLIGIEELINKSMEKKLSWRAVLDKEHTYSLVIMAGLKTLQQFSGSIAIDSYMQTIVASSNTGISPEIASIIYGFIQIPAVLVTAYLVDKIGRKPIMIISSIGVTIALVAEGSFFYLKDYLEADVSNLSYLPVTALIVFAVMNNFGLAPIPYILMGELFATNIKELACTLTITYSATLAFLMSKFFEPISVEWGRYTMFWICAVFTILGALFVFFYLPETKGKTFDEIQTKLGRSKKEQITQKEKQGVV